MTDQADKKRIEVLELENVALRKRVMILEGAHKVLSTRILAVFDTPRSDPKLSAIDASVGTYTASNIVKA